MNEDIKIDFNSDVLKQIALGFNGIANRLENIEKNQKIQAKAIYDSSTKEGKKRYINSLKQQGYTNKQIAKLLDLSEARISQLLSSVKQNGK